MKRGLAVMLVLLVMVLVVIGSFFYVGYGQKIIRLPYAEINEYNGTRLDSINDFRENSIQGIQYIDIDNYTLKVDGLVENSKNYTYEEVLSHQTYEKVVRLNCVEGWSANILWKGILINDLFNETKPLSNARIIIFHAYDGYTVTYPVDYFLDKNILLAYEMNNVTIPPERGFPFVLVAEDKWGYKWIKWITEIEFSDDINYFGYWESRGYSAEGNLNESFIG
jgi:DMSO/TMAO reductase YedYZ molybdopterin-dependent catalytic subunit